MYAAHCTPGCNGPIAITETVSSTITAPTRKRSEREKQTQNKDIKNGAKA
jgi:hypothetical protein